MTVLNKIFCSHKWIIHIKKNFTTEMFTKQYGEYKGTGVTRDMTTEVLICEKCGKIKKIEY